MTGISEGPFKGKPFRLKRFSEIKLSTTPNYLIKGVLPHVGLAVIWGPPKCGKSFWTFDAVMHVVLNWLYRGRKVQQGTVIYCALEGGTGFARRVEAWRQRYLAADHEDVPFYLLDVPLDLIADHAGLIEDISEQVTDAPLPVCIVIDTLNRALAGSENNPEDMAKFIRAADALRVAFNCLVVIVHHCGLEERRPRGHSSLPGADDVQIKVERDSNGTGTITATVEHMKDDEAGATVTSRLERVEIGPDDDGDEMTSCVIVACDGLAAPQKAASKDAWGKSNSLKVLRRIMMNLLADCGEQIKPFADGPVVRALKLKLVRAEFIKTWPAQGSTEKDRRDAKTLAFRRALTEAMGMGVIVTRELGGEDFVWLASADPPPAAGRAIAANEAEPSRSEAGAPTNTPLASWEIDGLLERGFTRNELFDNPGRAQAFRAFLTDPRYERMRERFRVGGKTAEPCALCGEDRNVRMVTGADTRGRQHTTALHLRCAPDYFERVEVPLKDTDNESTVASMPAFLPETIKRELQELGCAPEQIRDMKPADGLAILAQRRKLAGVLAAWSASIGCTQPRTVEQVIAAADGAVADDGGKLKAALAAVAGPNLDRTRLDEWLRDSTSIEVKQLTLREAGADQDGRPLWTVELRVGPDRGSSAD